MNHLSRAFRPIIQCFLAGVFAVLPLVVTVAVVMWVAGMVGSMLGPGTVLGDLLQRLGLQFASNTLLAYIIGWVVVLALIFVLGVLVEIGAKRFIQGGVDALAKRVPLLGGVYGTVRQLVGMMDKQASADLKGMSVVFCVFGKETGAAFLALLATPERFHIGQVDYHAVIIPSAPVPVGGSLIFVPAESVQEADLTVDAFMSIYVSMGVTGPQFLPRRRRLKLPDAIGASKRPVPSNSFSQTATPLAGRSGRYVDANRIGLRSVVIRFSSLAL